MSRLKEKQGSAASDESKFFDDGVVGGEAHGVHHDGIRSKAACRAQIYAEPQGIRPQDIPAFFLKLGLEERPGRPLWLDEKDPGR